MATSGMRMVTAAVVYSFMGWTCVGEEPQVPKPDAKADSKQTGAKSDKARGKEADNADVKDKQAKSKDQKEKHDAAERIEDADAENASPDEKAIRALVRQVEDAFNKHDAKALTAFFSQHGEIIDAGGNISQGTDEITKVFTDVFEKSPEAQMNIDIESIRILGSAVAIEEGTTRIVHAPGEAEEVARYAVVYSKEGDEWKMISARDLPKEAAVTDHLSQLEWLVGDWIDESDDSVVMTSYRFSANNRYLVGQFHVETEEEGILDGTVHIGWDPQLKQLRSWVFDSEGGFATGLWASNEDTWIIKLTGVLADGRTSTCTYRMHRLSSDQAEVDSRDRVIGGILIDDSDPVTIVRRGPAPETLGDE